MENLLLEKNHVQVELYLKLEKIMAQEENHPTFVRFFEVLEEKQGKRSHKHW